MAGTSVETLPGGLIDRITSGGRVAVTTQAWRRFAWDTNWMALPDGTARPLTEVGEQVLDRPGLDGIDSAGVEEWIIGCLVSELRGWRATLPQYAFVQTPELGGMALDMASEVLVEAQRRTAERPDLSGFVHLLAADLGKRAWRHDVAEEQWELARRRLAGDAVGQAVAWLVRGDWHAAPFTSPLNWNCALEQMSASVGNELPDVVEAAEFDGTKADVAVAEVAYGEAALLYERAGDRAGLAAVELRRSYLALQAGDVAQALKMAEHARVVFEQEGRWLDATVAATHVALAAITNDRAPKDFEPGPVHESVGHAAMFGRGLLCVRMARHWAGKGQQPERAQAVLGLARRLWKSLNERDLHLRTIVDNGEIAASLGRVAAARVALQEALEASAQPSDAPKGVFDPQRTRKAFLAARMHMLANMIGDETGMERASRILRDTVEPLRTEMDGMSDGQRTIAEWLLSLADTLTTTVAGLLYRARAAQMRGDASAAAELFAEARARARQMPIEQRDQNEAMVMAYEGDNAGASDVFERHVTRALRGVPAASTEARMLHVQAMDFQVVVENSQRARFHRDALTGVHPWWAGLGPAWKHLGLEGRLLALENRLPEAKNTMDLALADVELVRARLRPDDAKSSLFALKDVQDLYLDGIRLALRMGDEQAAFSYAERARARALLDLMTANEELDTTGLPGDLVTRWRAASAEVALAQSRLGKAGEEGLPEHRLGTLRQLLTTALDSLDAVETELRQVDPGYWRAVNPQADVTGLDMVSGALPADAALIQYVMGSTDVMCWAVTDGGMVASKQFTVDRGLVDRLVDEVLAACTTGGDYLPAAQRLAKLLVEPFDEVIEQCGSLFVVPGGATMRLPFAVLPWRGEPLGAAQPISVLPSASMLCLPQRARTGNGHALVVGNPQAMSWRPGPDQPAVALSSLPGAESEAVAVARVLGDVEPLIGPDATLDRVLPRLPEASVVHLATHGILAADAPLASAIALAGGAQLTVGALVGQQLSADLVVLSACHTGTGAAVRGDELLGFGRALLAAGARAAVVTSWAVNDTSAALLMTEFHRRRVAGASDLKALWQACRFLRTFDGEDAAASQRVRDLGATEHEGTLYNHPHHWAPFTIVSIGQ
ncbi:hypothetical protein Lesp02_02170 [Lentzea sp. NBRC 105346]|uniref:CHAT domain-containing protein n=1 Tax=Lentzea sp. NBRC 105346 TaxID=3032205 RepID=UPI0024A0D5D4|nr:CHAT domain-containing protein [Lentzea sp. NBRC 105346]GLZ28027.1 hypothetical protein Lesp02_02170 [Lentzea sp. NBRC 105346]